MTKLSLSQPPKKSDARFDDWMMFLWRAVAAKEFQPLDADLTSISSLSLTSNQVLGKDGAGTGWEGKTIAEGDGILIANAAGSVTVSVDSLFFSAANTGSVTQGSGSGKATGVTLNKPFGTITLDAAALAANTAVSFVLTNSFIGDGDILVVSLDYNSLNYQAWGHLTSAGTANIALRNISGGSLSEAVVIKFALIKVSA